MDDLNFAGIFEQETSAQPVQVDVDAWKEYLRVNPEAYIEFYLGDHLTTPVPQLHKDIFSQMTSSQIPYYAAAIPRDHAKTTLAKLSVLHYFYYTEKRFCVYLSNTFRIAADACLDIVNFLKTENHEAIFGAVEFAIERESFGFWKFKIYHEGKIKTCILKALGVQQQVRGTNIDHQRPDLAIVDDMEDAEEILTPDQYKKRKTWFWGTFRKALDKFNHKIIVIGNYVAKECMLKEFIESEYWHTIHYGCLKSDGTPLWPEAFPLEKLRREFNEYLNAGMMHVWMAEMMNLPIAEGAGLIQAEEIQYAADVYPGQCEYGCITIDPAISKQKWAKRTSVCVHGFVNGRWQLVDYRFKSGVDPFQLWELVKELAFMWGITVIGIENVAYQAALQHIFPYFAMQEGIEGFTFVELLTHNQRKAQRLVAWASMIKQGQYMLTRGDFTTTNQLLNFDPMKDDNDDDLIDGAAYIIQMIDLYIYDIMNTLNINPMPEPQDSYDVCEV